MDPGVLADAWDTTARPAYMRWLADELQPNTSRVAIGELAALTFAEEMVGGFSELTRFVRGIEQGTWEGFGTDLIRGVGLVSLLVGPMQTETTKLPGSGPAPGVIEVSPRVQSTSAFQNYKPRGGAAEFVFDPETNTFLVGNPRNPVSGWSPHENLAQLAGANQSRVVGGMLSRGPAGEVLTNEMSGHFWENWTPEIREQFVNFMRKMTGINIEHQEGM